MHLDAIKLTLGLEITLSWIQSIIYLFINYSFLHQIKTGIDVIIGAKTRGDVMEFPIPTLSQLAEQYV